MESTQFAVRNHQGWEIYGDRISDEINPLGIREGTNEPIPIEDVYIVWKTEKSIEPNARLIRKIKKLEISQNSNAFEVCKEDDKYFLVFGKSQQRDLAYKQACAMALASIAIHMGTGGKAPILLSALLGASGSKLIDAYQSGSLHFNKSRNDMQTLFGGITGLVSGYFHVLKPITALVENVGVLAKIATWVPTKLADSLFARQIAYITQQALNGKPIETKGITSTMVSGLLSSAAGELVNGIPIKSSEELLQKNLLAGSLQAGVSQITQNCFMDRPLTEGVGINMLVGGATSTISALPEADELKTRISNLCISNQINDLNEFKFNLNHEKDQLEEQRDALQKDYANLRFQYVKDAYRSSIKSFLKNGCYLNGEYVKAPKADLEGHVNNILTRISNGESISMGTSSNSSKCSTFSLQVTSYKGGFAFEALKSKFLDIWSKILTNNSKIDNYNKKLGEYQNIKKDLNSTSNEITKSSTSEKEAAAEGQKIARTSSAKGKEKNEEEEIEEEFLPIEQYQQDAFAKIMNRVSERSQQISTSVDMSLQATWARIEKRD